MKKKKPVEYETFWVVFDEKGELSGEPRVSRLIAISDFMRGDKYNWLHYYRRGYRAKKVGVLK